MKKSEKEHPEIEEVKNICEAIVHDKEGASMNEGSNIGLPIESLNLAKDYLTILLSNEYFLYLKTLNFHWNITGQHFITLHKFLETQYEWLKNVIDEVAERIRTLGFVTPVNYKKYAEDTSVHEGIEEQTAQAMLEDLIISHKKIIKLLREFIKNLSSMQDYGTLDILIKILQKHEKYAWMLQTQSQKT